MTYMFKISVPLLVQLLGKILTIHSLATVQMICISFSDILGVKAI
jgi:hypothetical protein